MRTAVSRDLVLADLWLVLTCAGLVRAAFLLWSLSGWYFFMPQSTLSYIYFQQGYAIAAGYGYISADSPGGKAILSSLPASHSTEASQSRTASTNSSPESEVQPELGHPPGMALLVALLYYIFASPVDLHVQVLGIALDLAAAGIFWWIVSKFLGRRIGLAAGLLYAVFPAFAFASVSKMPDGFLSFFVLSCLACTLNATRKGNWLPWTILAGLSVGIGAYLRPDYLLLILVMFFGLWAYTRRFWDSAVRMSVVQITALLVLLPWGYRNYEICERWIFTSAMVGGVLITGLGEFNNPWGFGGLDEDRYADAKAQGISNPWSCEGDQHFRNVFVTSVSQDPAAYAMTVLRRVPFVIATPYQFGFQNPWKTTRFLEARTAGEDMYDVLRRRPWYVAAAYWDYLAMAIFSAVCFLATLLMIFKERDQLGLILLIISPHLYAVGSHLLTHFEPRFVLPSMFGLIVGLSYVLSTTIDRSSDRQQYRGALRWNV
jgi:4-amino-4-deoxy-L-arabinose transferase-like glycosyltransferase